MSDIGESYTCSVCKGVFEKTIEDSEALAETESMFGPESVADKAGLAIVCDDCWKKVFPMATDIDRSKEEGSLAGDSTPNRISGEAKRGSVEQPAGRSNGRSVWAIDWGDLVVFGSTRERRYYNNMTHAQARGDRRRASYWKRELARIRRMHAKIGRRFVVEIGTDCTTHITVGNFADGVTASETAGSSPRP